MGKAFPPPIPDNLAEWICNQALFFVGTAPPANGHINISPKSASQFRLCASRTQCAYLDLTGSGHETCAQLQLDPRITVMFVALRGAPRILRLFGTAKYMAKPAIPSDLLASLAFCPEDLADPGFRGLVVIDIKRISTSCGYSVPIFDIDPIPRTTLRETFQKKGEEGTLAYWREKNYLSIDGLPGYQALLCPDQVPFRVEPTDGFLFTYDYRSQHTHRRRRRLIPLLALLVLTAVFKHQR